ncbi:MAG: patatin-like phospholipase RssA [Ottowia sp.]|uniref:patatin-like phospholipase RssA n=1 Tax=Ottowia sp. TaxID=1898956 RepID=UPI0039E6B0A9
MPTTARRPVIGLALGSGSARGWAHIGVLRALTAAGIRPDVVCGASVGAIVGAAYAAGELDRFEQWVLGMDRRAVMSYMDFSLGSGVLKGERLVSFMRAHFGDRPIEALPMRFAAVATALHSGDEVWLREGSVADAVRASFALPGLFTPVWREGRLLVDGGLVNPVPVSLARALGAEVVIAVDLNSDKLGRYFHAAPSATDAPAAPGAPRGAWVQSLQHGLGALWPRGAPAHAAEEPPPLPSLMEVLASSIQVMQVRITRSRMAGDPPEAAIAPRLAQLGLLDFHRAREAIDAGRAAAEAVLPLLRLRGLSHSAPDTPTETPTESPS